VYIAERVYSVYIYKGLWKIEKKTVCIISFGAQVFLLQRARRNYEYERPSNQIVFPAHPAYKTSTFIHTLVLCT